MRIPKQKYYITFDPKELIIWGIGTSVSEAMSDAAVNLSDQGVVLPKTKTIECGKDFFTTVYEDGHCQDMTWAIVNGTPTFIHEETFFSIDQLLSTKFRKKTFTIERPR